jgi:hypothetical protein
VEKHPWQLATSNQLTESIEKANIIGAMKRSGIEETRAFGLSPDCATLHPGYMDLVRLAKLGTPYGGVAGGE